MKQPDPHQLDPNRNGCAGFRSLPRRHAIQSGVLGAFGLSMGEFFRLQAADNKAFSQEAGQKREAKALSVIQLHLPGGFQQQESFDPKPEAPVEICGQFGVTKTKDGDYLSDNFPKTAAVADKLTVIRSMVGKIPDHNLATYHLFTGYIPTPVIDFPQMG